MKLAHFVNISVFSKPEDNEEQVKEGLLRLLPFKIEEEKISIQKQTAKGFNERKIIIYELDLRKDKQINKFLEFLKENISKEQTNLILKQVETRLDHDLNFFIRLDKQSLEQGNFLVTDSGDCYHIKINLAAFPRTREAALKVALEIFK